MSSFIASARKTFEYYKTLGEKTFEQLSDEDLNFNNGPEDNSIAIYNK